MGKQGPCCHCGVTSTPLWRNGPPGKPVLCNACGSRWRTKGTLANYTPLHARAGPDDYEDHRALKVKGVSKNKKNEVEVVKRTPTHENMLVGRVATDYNHDQKNILDEDISNRSSSGSVISNSESCFQFGSAIASDLTGSFDGTQSVPSKKRTSVHCPKQSPFERLTKDLYTIWHEQQSSCFSGSSGADLLFGDEKPMVSVEIGHGSVLIRLPSSIQDDEYEASSLSVEKKQPLINETNFHSLFPPLHDENVSCLVIEKDKCPTSQDKQPGLLMRDKVLPEKVQGPGSHDSPLCDVDLNDVLNFEVFARLLTNEEQEELLKYVSPLAATRTPDSIRSMFDSPEFKENILIYQGLLVKGVFELSFSGPRTEECETLKKLTLSNLSKSKWVEHCNLLKKCRNDSGKALIRQESDVIASKNSVGLKRSHDNPSKKIPGMKPMKIPKRVIAKTTSEIKEFIDKNGSCFSPRRLFASSPNGSSGSLILNSVHFIDESSSDQDLLLDLPSNQSFPQAELLHPTNGFGQLASTSSSLLDPHPMLL